MNDTVSNSATSAPPSSAPAPSAESPAPSTPSEKSSPETLGQLSTPEDVSQYVEQRLADEGQTEQQASEPKKRANRYERLRRARDAAQAEAAALKAQSTSPRSDDGKPEDLHRQLHPEQYPEEFAAEQQADTNGQPPPEGEGYAQTPEEAAEAREQLRQQMMRDADVRADYRARERQVASSFPDYAETIQAVGDVDIGPTAAQLLRESPHGPFISYGLAKTTDGWEILHALKDAPPLEVAKFIAKAEAQIEAGNRQRAMRQQRPQQPQYPQRRVATNAPRPVGYLKGSAGPTPSYSDLANGEDIQKSGYAAKRLQQMRKDR